MYVCVCVCGVDDGRVEDFFVFTQSYFGASALNNMSLFSLCLCITISKKAARRFSNINHNSTERVGWLGGGLFLSLYDCCPACSVISDSSCLLVTIFILSSA